MSADNWSICPMCGKDIEPDSLIPFDENEDNYTVREEYEFVLNDDGTLNIWYSGVCNKCGTKWEYIKENVSCKKVV